MNLSPAQTEAALRRHEEELAAEEAMISAMYPIRTGKSQTIDYGTVGVVACVPVMIAVALLFTFLGMASLHHFVNEWILLAGGVILSLGSLVGTLKFFFWLDLKQY